MNEYATELGRLVAAHRDSEHSLNLKDYDRLALKAARIAESALENVHPDDVGQVLESVARQLGVPNAVRVTEDGFEVGEIGSFRDVGGVTGRVIARLDGRSTEVEA